MKYFLKRSYFKKNFCAHQTDHDTSGTSWQTDQNSPTETLVWKFANSNLSFKTSHEVETLSKKAPIKLPEQLQENSVTCTQYKEMAFLKILEITIVLLMMQALQSRRGGGQGGRLLSDVFSGYAPFSKSSLHMPFSKEANKNVHENQVSTRVR